ncbi:unnamed protein product, partial [Prorocentrum cordatum]
SRCPQGLPRPRGRPRGSIALAHGVGQGPHRGSRGRRRFARPDAQLRLREPDEHFPGRHGRRGRRSDVNTVTSAEVNSTDLADHVAGRVADDVIAQAFVSPPSTAPDLAALRAENDRLKAQLQDDAADLREENERLRGEVERARRELEPRLALLEAGRGPPGAELQDAADLRAENESLRGEVERARRELEPRLALLEAGHGACPPGADLQALQEELLASRSAEAKAKREGDAARAELERLLQEQGGLAEKPSRDTALEDENNDLRLRVSSLEEELSASKDPWEDLLSAKPTVELPSEPPEDNAVLTEAYKKISELNTQLARLYAELTLARAEAQHLRGSAAAAGGGAAPADGGAQAAEARAAEGQKHSQQIDLVSDIRHLQLDLEYHQQKLDQMIREKQQLLAENQKLQTDLTDLRQSLEEQDQMLKHREVDLEHLREELKLQTAAAPGGGAACDHETLAALRSEAASKDSALIVSHYELHKEKLVRDRLEQKNVKLMERMQKLMMVVESMRKENGTLERALRATEQQLEESDAKAREASRRAKKAQGGLAKGGSRKKVLEGSVEFEAPAQHELPRIRPGGARSTRRAAAAGCPPRGPPAGPRSRPTTPAEGGHPGRRPEGAAAASGESTPRATPRGTAGALRHPPRAPSRRRPVASRWGGGGCGPRPPSPKGGARALCRSPGPPPPHSPALG